MQCVHIISLRWRMSGYVPRMRLAAYKKVEDYSYIMVVPETFCPSFFIHEREIQTQLGSLCLLYNQHSNTNFNSVVQYNLISSSLEFPTCVVGYWLFLSRR